MIRTFALLIFLVALFALVFAPAALLRQALPAEGGVALTGLAGTLWNGRGDLVLGGRAAGTLVWRVTPVTILQGALGYHLRLTGPEQTLAADLLLRLGGLEAVLDGTARGSYFNDWLAGYDIELAGDFAFESASIALPYRFDPGADPAPATGSAGGRVTWSGGPVRYRLSGQDYAGTLPPLEARLGEELAAVVQTTSTAPAPLLRIELLANGFVRIGVTRLLTRMLNNPWPGADTDHEVVLEVEEQLL